MDHCVPFGMLFIDFVINAILFNPWHVIITIIVMIIYGIVNMSITLISGQPIYPIMTWKNIETLYYSIGILALTLISYLMFSYISFVRNNKINKSID